MDQRTTQDTIHSIRAALGGYQDMAERRVRFDIDAAASFEMTPHKRYTARSASVVEHLGEAIGNLTVIVFDEGDCTGNESDFQLARSMAGGNYPLTPQVVPRRKVDIRSEAHLAIATLMPGRAPQLYANNLDLIGLKDERLNQLAHLGLEDPAALMHIYENRYQGGPIGPTATLTTGFNPYSGERFGDPHAVYNNQPFVQIAGFLALTDETAVHHASAFSALGAKVPALRY